MWNSIVWAPSSEFVSSSIPSWQILTAHAQPSRGARDLAFCLKVSLDSLLIWASSEGSDETARMRRLAWTFAARIGYKYQIRLTRSVWFLAWALLFHLLDRNYSVRYVQKFHSLSRSCFKFILNTNLLVLFRADWITQFNSIRVSKSAKTWKRVYTLDDEFHIGPKSGEKYTHLSKEWNWSQIEA